MDENKPKPLQPAQAKALRALNDRVCAKLPQDLRDSGNCAVTADNPLNERRVTAPNGRYRVMGSEYVLTVQGGRLTEVVRADPPDFGGDDVIAVEFDAAGVVSRGA